MVTTVLPSHIVLLMIQNQIRVSRVASSLAFVQAIASAIILINNSFYLGKTFRKRYAEALEEVSATTSRQLEPPPIDGVHGVVTGLLGLICSLISFYGNKSKSVICYQLGLSLFVLEKACIIFVENISSIDFLNPL